MHEKAFAAFRDKMATYFPELDEKLADGPAGLEAWWTAVKSKAESLQPGLGAAMDQLDFMELYNKNEAVPDDCVIPFIPFRFHVVRDVDDDDARRVRRLPERPRPAICAVRSWPPTMRRARWSRWPPTSRSGSICTWPRWKTPNCCARTAQTPPIRTQQHIVSLMSVISAGILFGPGGSDGAQRRRPGRLLRAAANLYGHDQYRLAEIEYWDPRESDCYIGEVPVPQIPEFSDYDLGLTAPTHFEAFRVYVPWMAFEDRGAGIPPEFQINGPETVGGDEFETLDFSKYLRGSASEGRLASITGPQTCETERLAAAGAGPALHGEASRTASRRRVTSTRSTWSANSTPISTRWSFKLGDIRIGDITIDIPDGRWSYQGDFDFTHTRGFVLRVSAGIDLYQNPAGVSWVLQAIDPLTGEVLQDATRGLLAPNDAFGKGRVSFPTPCRRARRTASRSPTRRR